MTTTVKRIETYQFEQDVVIPEDGRVMIEIPPEIPIGRARITLTVQPEKGHVNRVGELRGIGKGTTWMADDFDAPLEDFKEYM